MRGGCKARTGQSGGRVSMQRRLAMRRECVWREKEDVTVAQKRQGWGSGDRSAGADREQLVWTRDGCEA